MSDENLYPYLKKIRGSTVEKNGIPLNESNQSYLQGSSERPFMYRTLGQQLKLTAEKYPHNEALVSFRQGVRLTFAEVLEKADQLGAAFYEIGLISGDRIGIWAPNSSAYYLATFAAARAGMISVGINPAFQIPELEYALNIVGVKALVVVESFRSKCFYEMLEELIPELSSCDPTDLKSLRVPSLTSVIIDSEITYPGTYSFQRLLQLPTRKQVAQMESLQFTICPDSGACLLFTSGTTGKPKGALLSHFALVNNAAITAYRHELDSKAHRICVQLPMFHVFGLTAGVISSLFYGSTVVIPGCWFRASESLEAIVKEQCTAMVGTPTMYIDLLEEYRKGTVSLHRMDLATFGGACCPPQVVLDIQNVLGVRRVGSVYGMTELSCSAFQHNRGDSIELAQKTVGRIMEHCEAKVVDRKGNILPLGKPGELWIRGFGNFLCYWGDESRTREVLGRDGWLKTGDLFVLRSDGYGAIVGRLKEVIIRGGENIYPRETEELLITHPAIQEAYCIGVPSERLGEEVCAYVRLRGNANGTTVDQEEVKRFCKDKIAYFKIPKYLRVVEEFPKTATGKIQKLKLLEMYMNENKENRQLL